MTLIEQLDKARKQMRVEARNAKITGDGDPSYYEANADGLYAAMSMLGEFVADNTVQVDAQNVVPIETLIGEDDA